MDRRDDVERGAGLTADQRCLGAYALRVGDEILVELAIVDGELSAAGTQKHASDARLATSRAVILNQISHLSFRFLSRLLPRAFGNQFSVIKNRFACFDDGRNPTKLRTEYC